MPAVSQSHVYIESRSVDVLSINRKCGLLARDGLGRRIRDAEELHDRPIHDTLDRSLVGFDKVASAPSLAPNIIETSSARINFLPIPVSSNLISSPSLNSCESTASRL